MSLHGIGRVFLSLVIIFLIPYLIAHFYTYIKAQALYAKAMSKDINVIPVKKEVDITTPAFSEFSYVYKSISLSLDDELLKTNTYTDGIRYESKHSDEKGISKVVVLKTSEYIKSDDEKYLASIKKKANLETNEELITTMMFMDKSSLSFFQPQWKLSSNLNILILKDTLFSLYGDVTDFYMVNYENKNFYVFKKTKVDLDSTPYSVIGIDSYVNNTVYSILYMELGNSNTISDETALKLIRSIKIDK